MCIRDSYAAGECSSVGIHGANRLGSNSLSELLVFGKVAGVEAARFAKSVAPGNSASLLRQAQAVEQRILGLKKKTGGTERIATLRKEMAQTMEDGCGIYRLAETMQKTCDKLDELKARFRNVTVSYTHLDVYKRQAWRANNQTAPPEFPLPGLSGR